MVRCGQNRIKILVCPWQLFRELMTDEYLTPGKYSVPPRIKPQDIVFIRKKRIVHQYIV